MAKEKEQEVVYMSYNEASIIANNLRKAYNPHLYQEEEK